MGAAVNKDSDGIACADPCATSLTAGAAAGAEACSATAAVWLAKSDVPPVLDGVPLMDGVAALLAVAVTAAVGRNPCDSFGTGLSWRGVPLA